MSPKSQTFLIVYFDGKLYIDHNIPFGLASAGGLQGEVTDAVMHIWKILKVTPYKKWVDNITIFCLPSPNGPFTGISDGNTYQYNYNLEDTISCISIAKVPWHKEQGQPFGDTVEYSSPTSNGGFTPYKANLLHSPYHHSLPLVIMQSGWTPPQELALASFGMRDGPPGKLPPTGKATLKT
ncbi:hypothetical protein PAXRUDRAFT_17444 [Paxillus rubicundulus Ve08.2h10]|uniref:Uncharacterized protein n=1 Tax=Paxillus rubicundulus Ve08.2h10 TaxID=930991 RepID=A0A0D0D1S5_9AGAM|nr:hypothetical protein PAXRUDRAFT_17444 [Paxillus rubicundulus Ve08.2h10]